MTHTILHALMTSKTRCAGLSLAMFFFSISGSELRQSRP